jgi:hypothetical protein
VTDLARHEHEWTRDELAHAWPGFAADELREGMEAAGLVEASVKAVGSCTLTRARTRERHAVDVLLASATRPLQENRPK